MGSLFIAYLKPLTGSLLPRMLDPLRLIPTTAAETVQAVVASSTLRTCLRPDEEFSISFSLKSYRISVSLKVLSYCTR